MVLLNVLTCRDCRFAVTDAGHTICNLLHCDIDFNDFCSFASAVHDELYVDDFAEPMYSNIKYLILAFTMPDSKYPNGLRQSGFFDVTSFVDYWQRNFSLIRPVYLKVVYDNDSSRIYHDIEHLQKHFGIYKPEEIAESP